MLQHQPSVESDRSSRKITRSECNPIGTTDAHGHRNVSRVSRVSSKNMEVSVEQHRVYRRESTHMIDLERVEKNHKHQHRNQRQHSIDESDISSKERRPYRIMHPQLLADRSLCHRSSLVSHNHPSHKSHDHRRYSLKTLTKSRDQIQNGKDSNMKHKFRRSSSDGDPPPDPPPPSPNSHELPDFKQINMSDINASVENLVQKHILKKKHSVRSIDVDILEDLIENEDSGLPNRSCNDLYEHRCVGSARSSKIGDLDVDVPEIRRHSDTPYRVRRISREDYERFQSDRLQKLSVQKDERFICNSKRKANDSANTWNNEQESMNAYSTDSISSFRSGNSGRKLSDERNREHLALDSVHSDTSLNSLPAEDRKRKLSK